jgi:hypothetical protein
MATALASRFTTGQLAVLKIVADEIATEGRWTLTAGEIAARAGVCHRLAQGAIRWAAGDGFSLSRSSGGKGSGAGSRSMRCTGLQRKSHARTHTVGWDQEDPRLLKSVHNLSSGTAAEIMTALLKIPDCRTGDASHVGQMLLGPIEETASSTTLRW